MKGKCKRLMVALVGPLEKQLSQDLEKVDSKFIEIEYLF